MNSYLTPAPAPRNYRQSTINLVRLTCMALQIPLLIILIFDVIELKKVGDGLSDPNLPKLGDTSGFQFQVLLTTRFRYWFLIFLMMFQSVTIPLLAVSLFTLKKVPMFIVAMLSGGIFSLYMGLVITSISNRYNPAWDDKPRVWSGFIFSLIYATVLGWLEQKNRKNRL